MDDLEPYFLVLTPGDPRLLKDLVGRADGPTDPKLSRPIGHKQDK